MIEVCTVKRLCNVQFFAVHFAGSHELGLESNDINFSQSSSQVTGCVCTLVHYDVTLMTIVTSQMSS